MRPVSRVVTLILVSLSLSLSLAVGASDCCVPQIRPTLPILEVLVPDTAAERWYACRGVAEEDLGIIISLNVMATTQEWAEPPTYPIEIMRATIYEMIREETLPDVAMLPRELAREISDRCYIYDLEGYACWINSPFYHDGVIDGVILPWASDLVVVFFEPGEHVSLGLSLLSHPVLYALRPPSGCCEWPPAPPEPPCPCNPCGP